MILAGWKRSVPKYSNTGVRHGPDWSIILTNHYGERAFVDFDFLMQFISTVQDNKI